MEFTATIITCNAALLIGRLLRHIEPLFDKIIVVDGPSSSDKILSQSDGTRLTCGIPHSTDGTVEILSEFQNSHPNKMLILSRSEPWIGKTSKFNKALEYTNPGYIWEFDYDEFYHASHICMMKDYLRENSSITAVEFWGYHFWGDTKHYTPMRPGAWGNTPPWRRIFKFTGREKWRSHEPPRLGDSNEVLLSRDETKAANINLYHYSYCKESQLRQKELFYNIPPIVDEFIGWKAGRVQKELCDFKGTHPIDVRFLDNTDPTRFCMITMHSPEYKEMADITIYQNKRQYCDRWGYDLAVQTTVDPKYSIGDIHSGGFTWDRLRVAIEKIKSGRYDWIYCVGCDTMITNMTAPLTRFIDNNYHFIIAYDCNEWNADSFFVRCSPEGIAFLEAILSHFEEFKTHPWVEQQVMINIRDQFPIWKVLPQRTINSYNYDLYPENQGRTTDCRGNDGQWQPGDFLCHWPSRTMDVRMADILNKAAKVVR